MPEADLLQVCLDELDGVDDFLARRELAEERAPVLLGRPGIASSLAARIARTADSERNVPLDLFGVLVERAQRDAENRRRFGEPFLAEARSAIDTLAASGDLPDHPALDLARAFVRAGLEAPECLFPIFAGEPATGQALAAFPGLLDLEIDRLARHAGGDDHLLHDLLGNQKRALIPRSPPRGAAVLPVNKPRGFAVLGRAEARSGGATDEKGRYRGRRRHAEAEDRRLANRHPPRRLKTPTQSAEEADGRAFRLIGIGAHNLMSWRPGRSFSATSSAASLAAKTGWTRSWLLSARSSARMPSSEGAASAGSSCVRGPSKVE